MSLLVRFSLVETPDAPAGAFREHAVGRGRLPGALLRGFGTYCVDTTDRVYSLTYDDGPDPVGTEAVLDALARHGATATFFVLASASRAHPELVRRIADEGHEIALHGEDHRSLLTMSTGQARRMIRAARRDVERISGRRVALYRPPYGEYTTAQAWAIRALGLELVIWSGYAEDWNHDAEQTIAGRAVDATYPGGIVLLHDRRGDPERLEPGAELPRFDRGEVLDLILERTRNTGYRELTVSDLVSRYPRVHSITRERMRRP